MLISRILPSRQTDLDNSSVFGKVIEKLVSLSSPSTKKQLSASTNSDSNVRRHLNLAKEAQKDWENTGSETSLKKARSQYILAIRLSAKLENKFSQADCLIKYANLCSKSGELERSIALAEKAILLYREKHDFESIYKNLGNLYCDVLALITSKEKSGLPGVKTLQKKLKPLRNLQFEAFTKRSNKQSDKTAYAVAQGEVGFSSDRPIGTVNLGDCLCLVVRDPATKKTALAHVDIYTSPESLQLIFDQMPKPTNEYLQVKLIGARHLLGGPKVTNDQKEEAETNLRKVMNFLRDKEVDIVSTSFAKSPSCVVIDPQTFEVFDKMPNLEYQDAVISQGKPVANDANAPTPLRVAFDLTLSEERAPILIDEKSVAKILRFKEDEKSYYDWFKSGAPLVEAQLPVLTEIFISLKQSHKAALAPILKALEDKKEELNAYLEKSFHKAVLSEDSLRITKEIITKHSIHIGHGAEEANQPLIDAINNLQVTVQGKIATINSEKLKHLLFPQQPYELIQRKYSDNSNKIRERRAFTDSSDSFFSFNATYGSDQSFPPSRRSSIHTNASDATDDSGVDMSWDKQQAKTSHKHGPKINSVTLRNLLEHNLLENIDNWFKTKLQPNGIAKNFKSIEDENTFKANLRGIMEIIPLSAKKEIFDANNNAYISPGKGSQTVFQVSKQLLEQHGIKLVGTVVDFNPIKKVATVNQKKSAIR